MSHPRRDHSRNRRVLCHGSRLHRFRSSLLLHTLLGIFGPVYQRECLTATSLFPSGGPQHRRALRSHRYLDRYESVKVYPDALRRVSYLDAETNKRLRFLTNNFVLPALTIAQTYKCRWQVELFFRWIKQHLRIKSFFGTSPNAVKTQIWIAVSIYLLVAIVRKRLELRASLYQILQILSVTLFEKVPILQALEAYSSQDNLLEDPNQLILFNF